MAFDAGTIEAKLILDRSQFDKELAEAERKAEAFEKKKRTAKVGLELDKDKAQKDLDKFMKDLAGLRDGKVKLSIDARQAQRDIQNLNRDMDRLKGGDITGTAKFDVDLNKAEAEAEASALAESLRRTVEFTVDLDAHDFANQINGLAGGDGRVIKLRVEVDNDQALTGLDQVRDRAVVVQDSFNDVDIATKSSMGTIAKYGAIGLAALGPVAAAVVALPGLFMAVATPVAAVVLGLDGIKQAVTPLKPMFADLKQEVSATFEQGLEPAIANTAEMLPVLQEGLVGSADALSQMATGITQVASSADGMARLESIFTKTNSAMIAGIPATESLIENFLALADIGATGLQALPAQMLAVGDAWDHVIQSLEATGVGAEAVEQLLSLLTQLLSLIAPLTQLGAQLMAALGPALTGAIAALSGALQILADVFGLLPGPIQTVIAAMAAYRLATAFMGRSSRQAALQATAMATAFRGAAVAGAVLPPVIGQVGNQAQRSTGRVGMLAKAGGALAGVFGGPMGLAVTGVVVGLSLFGTAMQEAQQRALESQTAIKGFADALKESGGAISQNVVAMVEQRASALTLDGALMKLGVSGTELATTLMSGQSAVTDLGARMLEGANQADFMDIGLANMSASMKEAGGLTQFLGAGIGVLGNMIGFFGTGAGDAVNNLNALNKEFNLGEEASRRLSEAQQTLNERVAATGTAIDRGAQGTALWAASLEALVDPTVSVADATKAGAAAFGFYSSEARTMQGALGNNVGTLMQFRDVVQEVNPAIIDSAGNIDLWAKGGLELQAAALQAAEGVDQLYGATLATTGSIAEAGAKAAMARQGFIEMGVAAGVPREKMIALAAAIMTIPPEVKTEMSTPGAVEAVAQAMGLKDAVMGVPDDKTVVVKSLTDEARAALESIGLQVINLPNGQVIITADPNPLLDTLPVIQDLILDQPGGPMPIEGDPAPVGAAAGAAAGAIQGMAPQMKIDGNASPAEQIAQGFIGWLLGLTPVIEIDGEPAPVEQTAEGAAQNIEGMEPKMGIGAEDRGAQQEGNILLEAINALMATIGIDAIDRGAGAKAETARSGIDGLLGTMGIDAQDRGAGANAETVRAGIDALIALIGVNAEDEGAAAVGEEIRAAIDALIAIEGVNAENEGALEEGERIRGEIDAMIGIMGVNAEDRGALAEAERIRAAIDAMTATIDVTIQVHGGMPAVPGGAEGGFFPKGFADGNVIEAFAPGGIRSKRRFQDGMKQLRSMSATMADIVAPGSWRVIGDRSLNPEAFIPINRSARSRQILKKTAEMMGYELFDIVSSGRKRERVDASGSYVRPGSVPEGQWGWTMDQYGGRGERDNRSMIEAIKEALSSRTVESLTVVAPQGSSVKEVVDEAVFRIKHATKGVHKKR